MVKELMSKVKELHESLDKMTNDRDGLRKTNTSLQKQYVHVHVHTQYTDITWCIHTMYRYDEAEASYSEQVASLQAELKNANHLLKIHSEVLPLSSPESGLSLTELYTKYTESTSKLREEKEENARLNNYLTQILQELEEKTPVLQKLRRDHDLLLRANEELQKKMEDIVEDSETLRVEAEESLKYSRSIERENKRLKLLTGDLSKQVKALLVECEEARGGVASTSYASFTTSEEVSSSSEVSVHVQ